MAKPSDLPPADDQADTRDRRDAAERLLDAALRALPSRYAFRYADAIRAVETALSALVDLLRAEGLSASKSLLVVKARLDRHSALSTRDYELAVTHSIARYFVRVPAEDVTGRSGGGIRPNIAD